LAKGNEQLLEKYAECRGKKKKRILKSRRIESGELEKDWDKLENSAAN
jgi:hypothetical protein